MSSGKHIPSHNYSESEIWAKDPKTQLEYFKARYLFLSETIQLGSSLHMLVAGASSGGGVLALSELFPTFQFSTVDPVNPLHDSVKTHLNQRLLSETQKELVPHLESSEEKYDVIIIENVPSHGILLSRHLELVQISLNPNGYLILFGLEVGFRRGLTEYLKTKFGVIHEPDLPSIINISEFKFRNSDFFKVYQKIENGEVDVESEM